MASIPVTLQTLFAKKRGEGSNPTPPPHRRLWVLPRVNHRGLTVKSMAGRDAIGSKVRALESGQYFQRFPVVHSAERVLCGSDHLHPTMLQPFQNTMYFETPLYLRPRLFEVSDVFSDVFSNGFRFTSNFVPRSSSGR